MIDSKDEIWRLMALIQTTIQVNYDGRKKEVGDRVIIWDWSYSRDINGRSHSRSTGYDEKTGIVIKTDCNFLSESFLGEDRYVDLLIVFEDGNKIYTRSDFVRRIDNHG
jgi:hypothetical protein